MDLAIEKALESEEEVPVGALVVVKGEILASSANRMVRERNPTAHAELLAINEAINHLQGSFLLEADLYVTLEPCPMCMYAISLARVRRLYFGAYDSKRGAISTGSITNACFHLPEIYDGIMQDECSDILKKFFKKLREK